MQGSQGKSRAVLYRSSNNRFILKSLPRHEVRRLLQFLPAYCDYLIHEPASLMPKFFDLYEVTLPNHARPIPLVVMENILEDPIPMGKIFDLKGSLINRRVGP